MPLPSEAWVACRALLGPDAEIHYLFQATSLWVGSAPTPAMVPLIVAVSGREVVLLRCSWWRRYRPKEIWVRFPRAIRLGPVDTSLTPEFAIGSVRLETDEEYVPVIRAADAEIAEQDFLPPDPLPDQ